MKTNQTHCYWKQTGPKSLVEESSRRKLVKGKGPINTMHALKY